MFNVPGGAATVARWPTRKYKKHRAYLVWSRRQELLAAGVDLDGKAEDEDDGTPRWEVVNDGGGDWESESHTRPW